MKSGIGALFQVIVSSVQLVDVCHSDAPDSLSLPAQHLNVAPVTT